MGHVVCPNCKKMYVVSNTSKETTIICVCGHHIKIQKKSEEEN